MRRFRPLNQGSWFLLLLTTRTENFARAPALQGAVGSGLVIAIFFGNPPDRSGTNIE